MPTIATHAVIVGNGEPPSEQLLRSVLRPGAILLSADGGANVLAGFGLTPDCLVGDLDSVRPDVCAAVPEDHRIRIDADNTGTDLVKVLNVAVDRGVTHAILLGFTGRRVDHTLWNLSLLRTYRDRLRLRFLDDWCDTRLIDRRIRFNAAPGQTLSLCPIGGPAEGVATRGLKFPLNGETLTPGLRDGISNEVVENPVEITVQRGDLLLCLHRDNNMGDIQEIGEG